MLKYVTVTRVDGNYVILALKKEPVNSLNFGAWHELRQAFKQVEDDASVQGVIFCSDLERNIFTAGNDISELYAPNTTHEKYKRFWLEQNQLLQEIYLSRLSTVAAIKGASPAGGCMLALCCDHRIMTRAGHIGLNEVLLGIPVPKFWGEAMVRVIGQRKAEHMLLTGKLISPQEALSVGLVDDLVDDSSMLLEHAQKLMRKSLGVPMTARAITKRDLRGEFVEEWRRYLQTEADGAWETLTAKETVDKLGSVLQSLSKRKSKL